MMKAMEMVLQVVTREELYKYAKNQGILVSEAVMEINTAVYGIDSKRKELKGGM